MDRKVVSVVVGFFVLSSISQAGAAPKTAGAKTSSEATAKAGRLEPWQPVDPAFNGCSKGVCGRRGRDARAIAQPGAEPGQYTYCPVSGAVFLIKETSQRTDVNGKPVYLCCEACARYFAENRDGVLAQRGLLARS
jgi:hypothetical protein